MKFDSKPSSVTKQRKLISLSVLNSSRFFEILFLLIFLASFVSFVINSSATISFDTSAKCSSTFPASTTPNNSDTLKLNNTQSNATIQSSDNNTDIVPDETEKTPEIPSKDSDYVADIVIEEGSPPNYDNLQPAKRSFTFTDFSKSLNKTGRQFWESITPSFKCPTTLLTKVGGAQIGGKWTCGIDNLGKATIPSDKSPCVVYSFGVNQDSTFEADVLASTHCRIYAYDPSVDKIGIPLRSSNHRVDFQKLGIWGDDHENLKTLKTLMKDNGDDKWIDILKMNVNHAEYPSLGRILKDFNLKNGGNGGGLPFGQLLVEMNLKTNLKGKIYGGEQVISLFKQLEKAGLRMFHKEINPDMGGNLKCEFSFINTDDLTLERVLGNEFFLMV